MRDPERIERVLAEIKQVWEQYPDLRLGQLLGNAINTLVADERGMTDAGLTRSILSVEDDLFLQGLDKLERRLALLHSQQEE